MDNDILNSVHSIQTDMLKQLHQRCKEQGIRYTLICGSLLGAIRHKGFIPWDDDVDIGLLREDYERLLESLKQKPLAGCFLQDYTTDPHYYQPYAKLVKEGTIYIEDYRKNCQAKSGIFVDIFPLDKIKAPGMKRTKCIRWISRIITFTIWHKEGCHMERKGIKKIANAVAAVLSLFPKRHLVSLQKRLVVRNNKDWAYAGSLFSSNYETDRLFFGIRDFDELIELPFESIVANAPRNWDENLKRLYKNYMELPPEHKRNSGHDLVRLELNV